MRKRICAVLLLLLVFSLCFGSAALAEQADEGLDHITDAGNILTAEEVQRLEALAAQYDELGVKLYIVTMEDYREYPGDGIMDCAGELYEYFDLGTQPDNNGVLLLLSMKELDYAVIVRGPFGNYCFGDANLSLAEEAFLNGCRGQAWANGFEQFLNVAGDVLSTASSLGLTADSPGQSAPGLRYPENSYVFGVLSGDQPAFPAETTAEPAPEPSETPAEPTPVPTPEPFHQDGTLSYVTDSAGILTAEQRTSLESTAARISESLNCRVYIVTVQDYRQYTNGTVNDCATELYTYYDLGEGPNRDGLLLLMSMQDRDYSIITHGFYGNYCFGDHNLTLIENNFLDNFRNNDWMGGFEDYLRVSGDILGTAAAHGLTLDKEDQSFPGQSYPNLTYRYGVTGKMPKGLRLAIGLGAPCLIALGVCTSFRAQMKTAHERTTAEEYVVPGSATLRIREDRFTHRTESRVPIQTQSSSSGRGGGGSFSSGGGGGFSGHSGKF